MTNNVLIRTSIITTHDRLKVNDYRINSQTKTELSHLEEKVGDRILVKPPQGEWETRLSTLELNSSSDLSVIGSLSDALDLAATESGEVIKNDNQFKILDTSSVSKQRLLQKGFNWLLLGKGPSNSFRISVEGG
uniref:Uncharacterized protein n=1 Tax=Timema tahoe TaxID=61484 RepID=A0A7R9IJL8_9NEOP|nr:unnamed protein product [Timema tahoe]